MTDCEKALQVYLSWFCKESNFNSSLLPTYLFFDILKLYICSNLWHHFDADFSFSLCIICVFTSTTISLPTWKTTCVLFFTADLLNVIIIIIIFMIIHTAPALSYACFSQLQWGHGSEGSHTSTLDNTSFALPVLFKSTHYIINSSCIKCSRYTYFWSDSLRLQVFINESQFGSYKYPIFWPIIFPTFSNIRT